MNHPARPATSSALKPGAAALLAAIVGVGGLSGELLAQSAPSVTLEGAALQGSGNVRITGSGSNGGLATTLQFKLYDSDGNLKGFSVTANWSGTAFDESVQFLDPVTFGAVLAEAGDDVTAEAVNEAGSDESDKQAVEE